MPITGPSHSLRFGPDDTGREGCSQGPLLGTSTGQSRLDGSSASLNAIARFRSLDRSFPVAQALRQRVRGPEPAAPTSAIQRAAPLSNENSGINRSGINNTRGSSVVSPYGIGPAALVYPTHSQTSAVESMSRSSSSSSSSSLPPRQLNELWQMVRDLRAENAVLQQRVGILMEGGDEKFEETLQGIPLHGTEHEKNTTGVSSNNTTTTTSAARPSSEKAGAVSDTTLLSEGSGGKNGHMTPYLFAEREAMLKRIRRLEAALKLEAMERDALELRLRAQERVLARFVQQ
ncbi:hypothetical protein, conserved [Trypanosoma brucei brucei TREU927]|uniref:Uncharacterized protein n=1 Tax=Trypanosoma brucei brucei (strain 927/4 GUTat10.1) TaxID=185431 RepID=Q4GYD8_TRYB2|nr:hypothetical protein, conserved [Trypanosoma brucei brucei TREU927]CAJ16646.1 hypothetical protein, conserved [Trypanosoma brucei brucei TREU927]